MGGFGSGRWYRYNKKTTTDDVKRIDVRFLRKIGCLPHWPDCYSIVLAGGGVRGGSIYGASDKMGAYPASDPITPGDVAATLFWLFGLDPDAKLHDLTGRPYLLAEGKPVCKLFT